VNSTLVLHDYFAGIEGGGRLCHVIARQLPADLGYGFARLPHPFVQGQHASEHDLQQFTRIPLWRQFKLARSFQHKTQFLKTYRTVIYSGFYTPLAICNHPQGQNIYYCHTPPRFIYDQRDFYLKQLPTVLRPVLQAFIDYLQPRYESAIARMDKVVTNSENVRQRIQHFLGIDADVIYPPCDTQQFTWQGQGDYYLSTARLDPLKRVEKIIRAFLSMPEKRLIVTSGGEQAAYLKRLARGAPHITFTGWVSEQQLQQLVGQAIAVLYVPTDEDFGMSPVEAMAAGKPVIGVAEGGLLETILHEKTGFLLSPQLTKQELCDAVHALSPAHALQMRSACVERAHQFTVAHFIQKISMLIK
jgi:glycosyltransferase involved in cell wall biosynthesis